MIRIPTGLGKTEAVLGAWAWNRLVRRDSTWPRRLVWCLPMRVLVQQSLAVAQKFLESMPVHNTGPEKVQVCPLMGGADVEDWHLHPEQPAVLIGTQDMLLSRALNRGYATGRARWPMEYGLLNHDCLWIMDEIQLMDVGLTTTEVTRRRGPWRGPEDVEFATLEWVHWYNTQRLLEPIGNVSPVEYEMNYYRSQEGSLEMARLN